MKLLNLVGALLIFVQAISAHADPKTWLYLHAHRSVPLRVSEFFELPAPGTNAKTAPALTYNQVIDHFRTGKSKAPTFKQRYFLDSTYAKDKTSPVIYYFCGEGACEGPSSSPEVNALAQKYHAYRVALEHRYYGQSVPFPTLDSKNLVYLSMDQAIEDLASFQKYLQSSMQLSGKWIAVGGSYAGELSAFYRLKHPELVVGSLASSGPVLSKADFFEYDRHVARVAGPACLSAIKTVVADVEAKLRQTDSSAAVKALFNATAVKYDIDFLYIVADMAASAIQYGHQDSFCKAIIDGVASGKGTEAYAKAGTALFSSVFNITPFQDSFQAAESVNPADYAATIGARSWMYQSCTEFGYYQIANPDAAESSRSQQITLPYHDEVCKRLFGLGNQVDTAATNHKFYDQLFNAKVNQIFLTNGSNDPWSNLSITVGSPNATQNPGLKLFTITGSSHCDDLGSRVSTALTEARTQFDLLVGQWISE